MRKKLVMSAMALALVMALVGGATFALFSDQSSNEATTLQAGTIAVDVERNSGEPVPGPMFYTVTSEGVGAPGQEPEKATGEWVPGMSVTRTLTVYNHGKLRFRICNVGAAITGDADFLNDPAAISEFANKMHVKIVNSESAKPELFDGTLAQLLADGGVDVPAIPWDGGEAYSLQAGSNFHLAYTCSLDTSAGNALQGTKPVVSFNLMVEQTKNNP